MVKTDKIEKKDQKTENQSKHKKKYLFQKRKLKRTY